MSFSKGAKRWRMNITHKRAYKNEKKIRKALWRAAGHGLIPAFGLRASIPHLQRAILLSISFSVFVARARLLACLPACLLACLPACPALPCPAPPRPELPRPAPPRKGRLNTARHRDRDTDNKARRTQTQQAKQHNANHTKNKTNHSKPQHTLSRDTQSNKAIQNKAKHSKTSSNAKQC